MEIKKLDIGYFDEVLAFTASNTIWNAKSFLSHQDDDIKNILKGGGIMAAVLTAKIIGISG